jgi:general secretion pathway protein D
LFKNVGIGREAQSLMMMVTPRIIIQEEEEAKLGIELPEQ